MYETYCNNEAFAPIDVCQRREDKARGEKPKEEARAKEADLERARTEQI